MKGGASLALAYVLSGPPTNAIATGAFDLGEIGTATGGGSTDLNCSSQPFVVDRRYMGLLTATGEAVRNLDSPPEAR